MAKQDFQLCFSAANPVLKTDRGGKGAILSWVPCLSVISQQLITAPISASIALRPETAGKLQLSTQRLAAFAKGAQRTISKKGLICFAIELF